MASNTWKRILKSKMGLKRRWRLANVKDFIGRIIVDAFIACETRIFRGMVKSRQGKLK